MSRDASDDSPADLPPIDAVDVVDVRAVVWQRFDAVLETASSPSVTVHGERARALAAIWRILPPGVAYRCHLPPFAFRFYAGGRLVAAASVCWRCNGVIGELNGQPWAFSFDGKHESSRALLDLAQHLSGVNLQNE